jgi:hypothetical protein
MTRSLTLLAVLLLLGCAVTPPLPSIWRMESECAETKPLAEVENCTRNYLNADYDDTWHSPQADQFLDFIGATAGRVQSGATTEADGRLAISNFAAEQSSQIQAQRGEEEAARQAALARFASALAAASQGELEASQQGFATKFMVYGGEGHHTYLGCLNCGDYAADSVTNQGGQFGSTFSATSIRNQFNEYGSRFSMYSACNPYATDPPVIVDESGNFYGRLTVNAMNGERTSDASVIGWLTGVCEH